MELVYRADHPTEPANAHMAAQIERAKQAAAALAVKVELTRPGRVPPGWRLLAEAPQTAEKGPADAERTPTTESP